MIEKRYKISSTIIIFIFCMATVVLANGEKEFDDQDIADAIEDQYLIDYVIDDNMLDVKVTDGVVELTGKTHNILTKERATDIANMVKGVRWVHNYIQVVPPPELSDDEILRNVKSVIKDDPATKIYDVNVSVNDNVVTLTGEVRSRAQKQLCETVVKGINGVVDVENDIKVQYKKERPDSEIRHDIEQSIRWDMHLYDDHINVFVKDGNVVLSGVVDNAIEKSHAYDIAWLFGIKDVDISKLHVSWWTKKNDIHTGGYKDKPDSEIKRALEFAMLFDPRVNVFDIQHEVENGSVTLRGIVDNLKAKKVAEKLAVNTLGVKDVTNRIKVRPLNPPSDEEIASNIKSALTINPFTELLNIDISVKDGNVILSGEVDNIFEMVEVENIANKIRGVTRVENRLKALSLDMSDKEIEKSIRLYLSWSPSVNAGQIEVTVINGTAILTGTIKSWPEYYAAADIAYEGGAISVVNKLKVK